MVQIITDKQTPMIEWIAGVLDRLNEFEIAQLALIAQTTDIESPQVIEFMNCNTDDMYYLGGVIQKEAVKYELKLELGFEDDDWEEDDEEQSQTV